MHALRSHRAPSRRRAPLLDAGTLGRLLLALAALAAVCAAILPAPAQAGQAPRLRGDVTAKGDVLTLGDLVENAPADLAARPLFRAPALGATGTIQTRRIVEAAARLDLRGLETGGRVQIAVQRAARRVGAPEIEAALKRALQATHGLDPRDLAVRLDGEAPVLLAPSELDGTAAALDVTYDPRSRRVAGLIVLGERQASLRVSGQTVEIREVGVLTRSLNRSELLTPADLTVERRPREAVPSDARADVAVLVGQSAQRALSAGAVLRAGDLAPPNLVLRGEPVTIVFEGSGVSLSLRGVANESGRLGASVAVLNPTSKKVIQATVVGAARVSVTPARPPVPVAQADAGARSGLN